MYLVSLRRAADSAALPAVTEVECYRYDAAVVSATVTSHTRQRPSRHGISERPSGRLPSDLTRPVGSFDAGIAALVILLLVLLLSYIILSSIILHAFSVVIAKDYLECGRIC